MRIAYLDCFSGMSGDMFLGALIDAGVSLKLLDETVAALDIGARLEISKVNRSGITATKVDVFVQGEKELRREEFWANEATHGHPHSDQHEHHHGVQGHVGGESGVPARLEARDARPSSTDSAVPRAGTPAPHKHEHDHSRSLTEIKRIIQDSAISAQAKKTAIHIFEALGAAEAKIHNMDIESVHFHEVGAVDAMVDIIGAAVGVEALGVDEIFCSPLNVGGGTVKCAHGTFPVPAPATVELLQGAPVFSSGIQAELLTPTGAAIVKTLATRFGAFPEMKIEKSAYGAGTRDFPGHANVLRLTIGATGAGVKASEETITVLEANLDDLNPQVFGYVMDRLREEGALDAFGMPVQMKKNRPGMLLTALCRPDDAAKLTQLIFAETTTLGVRRRDERRQVLERTWLTIATRWGDVRLKIASRNGTVTNYAPEYEDCRRIALEHRVPLKSVIEEAVQVFLGSTRAQK